MVFVKNNIKPLKFMYILDLTIVSYLIKHKNCCRLWTGWEKFMKTSWEKWTKIWLF